MIQSAELLQHFRVRRVLLKYSFVRFFRCDELRNRRVTGELWHERAGREERACTHVLLLFVHVTDLEPDIDLGERPGRIVEDVSEALRSQHELVGRSMTSIHDIPAYL